MGRNIGLSGSLWIRRELDALRFSTDPLGNPHPELCLVAYRLRFRDMLRRGDLFWGTGATAGQLALATHSEAQMWLLLPRGQAPSLPRATTARSRAGDGLPECVVADPDLCVEE